MTILRDEIQRTVTFAQEHLTQYGVLKGTAIVVSKSGRKVLGYDVHSEEEQKIASEIFKAEVKKENATCLILMSDGQRTKNATGEKQDCVVIVIVTKITTARVVIPFVKVAETFIFGNVEVSKDKTAKERFWHDLFYA